MVYLTDAQSVHLLNLIDTEGITYFKTVSTDDSLDSVSSYPIKICQYISGRVNCTFQTPYVKVKKGHSFSVSIIAVDQIGQPVDATIQKYSRF